MEPRILTELRRLGSAATSADYTHEWLDEASHSYWKLENSNVCEFYRIYCELSSQAMDEGIAEMHLAERIGDSAPFIVDLNASFRAEDFDDPDDLGELYDDELILKMVHLTQEQLIKDVKLDDDQIPLTCVVLESDPYLDEQNDVVHVNIRLQFPYCRVDSKYQTRTILPNLATKLGRENVMSNFHKIPNVADWGRLLVPRETNSRSLVMYGSTRAPGTKPVIFYKAMGYIPHDQIQRHDEGNHINVDSYFPPSYHSYIAQGLVPPDIFEEEQPVNYWLPIVLSTGYFQTVRMAKRHIAKPVVPVEESSGYDIERFAKGEVEEIDKMKLAVTFLEMWNLSDMLVLANWKVVGEALYDASGGDVEGLDLWRQWTHRMVDTEDFQEIAARENPPTSFYGQLVSGDIDELCDDYYKTFRTHRTTIKSLAYYARERNPRAYAVWHRNWCRKALEMAISTHHNPVAVAFYRLYWLEYTCTSSGKSVVWYEFTRHKLKQTPRGMALTAQMSGDFVRRFKQMRFEILKQSKGAREGENSNVEDIIKQIGKIIVALWNHGYKQSILSELSEFYIHNELDSLIDDNFELLGLPNGVLVVDETGASFRAGRPEDYITRSTKAAYHRDYHYNHPRVRAFMAWIGQIFVDEELRVHFLRFFSSVIRGGNDDKKIPAFSGMGDNSKSMLVKLFEEIYGDYSAKVPVSIATGGRGDANGPSPAIARLKSTRICFLEEPEKGIPFQVSLLKQLSGFDSFFGRMLKKNGGDIKPSFKTVIVCNDIPAMPNGDKAMKNRFCIFPFLSTWVRYPPETVEQQYAQRLFKMDRLFSKRIPGMAAAALWVAVEQYTNAYIPANGLGDTPAIVTQVTQDYWNRNDVYYQFMAAQIEVRNGEDGQPDMSHKLHSDIVYMTFKSWFRESFPNVKVNDKPTVIDAFTARCGKPVMGHWYGLKLRQSAPELNDRNSLMF